MPCAEMTELENIWKKRFDRANSVDVGGLFAVSATKHSHALTVRQHRAKQAQAAQAILMHQRQCQMCNTDQQAQPEKWSDSRAS